jgi:hypothetical protein
VRGAKPRPARTFQWCIRACREAPELSKELGKRSTLLFCVWTRQRQPANGLEEPVNGRGASKLTPPQASSKNTAAPALRIEGPGNPALAAYVLASTNSLNVHIIKIAVRAESRRQGYATALLKVCLNERFPCSATILLKINVMCAVHTARSIRLHNAHRLCCVHKCPDAQRLSAVRSSYLQVLLDTDVHRLCCAQQLFASAALPHCTWPLTTQQHCSCTNTLDSR